MLLAPAAAYAEPPAQPRIHFAAISDRGRAKTPILLRSFKPGLNVTLLKENEICKATTGATFSFETYGGNKATELVGTEKCPEDLLIAVVGAAAEFVQLQLPEKDPAPPPKSVERKARQIATPQGPSDEYSRLANSPPKQLKIGKFTLLKFEWKLWNENGDDGPAVLVSDNGYFPMGQDCGRRHLFFSVNDKLHLAFIDGKCHSGYSVWVVYDLSTKKPIEVYANADMAD
jgi:hypothetical protein